MPVFFADHTGRMKANTSFLRPIHIGASLLPSHKHGPEPDSATSQNTSQFSSYADLRLYSYLGSLQTFPDIFAIMQYRRYFVLRHSSQDLDDFPQEFFNIRGPNYLSPMVKISPQYRKKYFEYLEQQSDDLLHKYLGQHKFVANLVPYVNFMTMKEQYKWACDKLFPGQEIYKALWIDCMQAIQKHIHKDKLNDIIQTRYGYADNCMITTRDEFRHYNSFLWSVLSDLKSYESCHRAYGYLGERIMSIYLFATYGRDIHQSVRSYPMVVASR